MRNSYPCDFFGEGQELKLTIIGYTRIEERMGVPIGQLLKENHDFDLRLMTELLSEGLRQYGYHPANWYSEQIQKLLDEGKIDTLADIQLVVVKAIIASRFLGKAAYLAAFPEEATEEDKKWLEENIQEKKASLT